MGGVDPTARFRRALAINRTRVLARRGRVGVVSVALLAATLVAGTQLGAGASGTTGAQYHGSPAGHVSAPIVAIASTPSGNGYWLAGADGSVYAYGGAPFRGSMWGHPLTQPIVGMAPTRSGNGYWLVARDGGIFSFGDAAFYGSTGGMRLDQPIVGMAATRSGRGYWMVASDGGVFSFGDARFFGSTGNLHLVRPVVGMAPTASGNGYWMVASDGGIFSFGDAAFYGSTGGRVLPAPIMSMAPFGQGYWLAGRDGSVYTFAPGLHSASAVVAAHPAVSGVASMTAPAGGGFWMATVDGAVYSLTASGQFVADPNTPVGREQAIVSDLVSRVNIERRARGLSALVYDAQLGALAQYWSANMAAHNLMYHSNVAATIASPAFASRWRVLRENIYNGWGAGWSTSGGAHVGFMTSAPHRATLLMPQLTAVGIGATCLNGHLWVTEEFALSIAFPMPPSPPVPPQDPIAAPAMTGPSC